MFNTVVCGESMHSIIKYLMEGDLSSGSMAAIRRIDPEYPTSCFAFLQILSQWKKDDFFRNAEMLRRYAAVFKSLLIARPLYDPRISLGKALALQEVSEVRIARLLTSEGVALRRNAVVIARYLSSKGQACDWIDLSFLLLEGKNSEISRLKIARDFSRKLTVEIN